MEGDEIEWKECSVNINGDLRRKVNIFGDGSNGHGQKEISYKHVSNCECLPRYKC